MTSSRPEQFATRLQIAGTIAALLLAIAAITWATLFSAGFPFLPAGEGAEWIGPPDPITTSAVGVDRANPRAIRFQHRFTSADSSNAGSVEIKALSGFRVFLNGNEVAHRAPGEWNWKQGTTIDLGPAQAGTNRLEIEVSHVDGPPLLWVKSSEPGGPIASSEAWTVEEPYRGVSRARKVNDTRRGPVALNAPTLPDILSRQWVSLLVFATLSAILSFGVRRLNPEFTDRWFPSAAWIGIFVFWAALFAFTIAQLPAYHGYDGPDHLNYVRYIVEQGRLPLASDGPAMYHPPLFYLLSAGAWNTVGEPSSLLHVLPFLSGLVQVGVAYGLARLLFPNRPGIAATAVLVAGLLPVNVVLASHFSNEPFHAALSACVILLTTRVLVSKTVSLWQCLWLGGLLGLTLLTKVTSLLLVPLVFGFLIVRLWPPGGTRAHQGSMRLVAVLVPMTLVAGGYYLRNWLELGRPAIGNWDVPGSPISWWQHPGFHTSRYFTEFGESLTQPFFAGYTSFADGIYATFWGDSLVSGVSSLAVRHPFWNYEWMTLVPALAVPATVLLFGGWAALAIKSFQGSDLPRRIGLAFLTTTVALYAFAVLFINIRLPFYAQAKASYALAALAPLALAGAYAICQVRQRLEAGGRGGMLLLFDTWLGTLAIALVMAFGA